MDEGNLARNLQASERTAAVQPEVAAEKPRRELPKPRWQQEKELEATELERRTKIGETVKEANRLDLEYNTSVTRPGSSNTEMATMIDRMDRIETLSYGKEIRREKIGDGSNVNVVSRRAYAGDPPRTAYVKPKSGETLYERDSQTGKVSQYRTLWDPEKNTFVKSSAPLSLEIAKNVEIFVEAAPRLRENIAACYGISPEEVPLRDHEIAVRNGLPPGESALREYGVSRLSDFVGLRVVPQTVLRAEQNNIDLNSVQEAVTTTNLKDPPRPVDGDDFDRLIAEGPTHPGATSLMRIACLHYLVQAMDGSPNNTLKDPETNEFSSIDNGASFGLSQREDVPQEDGTTKTIDTPLDQMLSLPIEVVSKHPDWKLDQEAHAEIKAVYDSMIRYHTKREELGPEAAKTASESAGKEAIYLADLMKFIFKNKNIAKKETISFMRRLGELVRNGRPPDLIAQGRLAEKSVLLLGLGKNV